MPLPRAAFVSLDQLDPAAQAQKAQAASSAGALHAERERAIAQRLAAERLRLRQQAGLEDQPGASKHFHRPIERAFTGAERDRVTLLFGGLTWKHERLIQAAFQGNGYNCVVLPVPDVAAFQLGKEFGNNGQCNPTYFTVGNLVQFLQKLESEGVPRQEIVDNYVFFTAGSCGPCRFGMYEAEYRYALKNAGFDGFRVLLFQQQDGIKAASGEPGLKFTVNFGMSMLNAMLLGDAINDLVYQIRPFEVNKGETDRVFDEAVNQLCTRIHNQHPFELMERAPKAIRPWLARHTKIKDTGSILCKIYSHLYGREFRSALRECRDKLNTIAVDRTRLRPVVKITGEFWAQITEGDGNFHMFRFIEEEGAQVIVEPIATWVAYMIHLVRITTIANRHINAPHPKATWRRPHQMLANELKFRQKWLMLVIGEAMWTLFYHRVTKRLGNITHHLVPQKELARVAAPFYNNLARGGEGHLEVGKNVYYTAHKLCHMVLGLKPFGCMPSSQSDGAQSAVVNRFPDMIYLPIETSGEGAVNAHSRVQMALGEAKVKAKMEMERILRETGVSLADVRAYTQAHPELRRPFYRVPHTEGVTSVAANFVLHLRNKVPHGHRSEPAPSATSASAV
ncbi:MAG: activator of (R)-2-hydroxyglutaryl-CoA dehydratase [Acidobacteria bacterium]|nr:MAG: activator of (R)-2-hydroxyglutaryl-CoA dehydratase [Acidobacteriota bacterium]